MSNIRDYKGFGTGEWHHIFSRGNGKMDVFRDDQDYKMFRARLSSVLGIPRAPLGIGGHAGHQGAPLAERVRIVPLKQGSFSIAAFCLMPNHFHFLIRQNTDIPTSKLFLKLLTSYSMYFNRKYDHVGHVFQDRFKAVRIEDDTQLKHVSAYIHINPKTARLVREAHKWPHSSYAEYIGKGEGDFCDISPVFELFKNAREYQRFVEDAAGDIQERKDARKLMLDE